jgi:hypothetical protein
MTQFFDFRIAPLGQDMSLRPLTQEGRNWISDNLPKDDLCLGRNAIIAADDVKDTLTGNPAGRAHDRPGIYLNFDPERDLATAA